MRCKLKNYQIIILSILGVCLFGRVLLDVSLAETTKEVFIRSEGAGNGSTDNNAQNAPKGGDGSKDLTGGENAPQVKIEPIAKRITGEEIRQYITATAIKEGVNPDLAHCIVWHESQYIVRNGDGGHSRGIWQISEIYHPEVSNTIAQSPILSTNWSIKYIKSGHIGEWSTRNQYCSQYKVLLD